MDKLFLSILLFSVCICVLLITYPLVAYLKALLIKQPVYRSSEFLKPVSIIIAAYNEENFLTDKLNFFLDDQEWIPGSEIIIISAGSNDKTNEILKNFANVPGVIPIIIDKHIVKSLALNIAFLKSKNDILIFSDCRQRIKKGSVKKLVHYFNDENIGVVNSTILDIKHGGKLSLIRRVLNSICLNESISGSSLNIHGALYGQRREVFRPFPEDVLFDDLFAVVSTINQNKRLIQAADVEIYDINFETYYNKNRIERLVRGLMIFLTRHWPSIKKLPNNLFLRFIIYRYLKLLLPFIILGIIVPVIYFSTQLNSRIIYYTLFSLFILIFSLAKPRQQATHLFKINFYFVSAIFKFFALKRRDLSWDKLTPEQIK